MADCTIIDKLNYILETKDLIKTALETQDVEVLESDTFRKYSEYVTEIRKVASVNGETGDIILKTINGQNLVGEGNIVIQGGEGGGITEETDPVFTSWKNQRLITLGENNVINMSEGYEEEWASSVLIGVNNTDNTPEGNVVIGNDITIENGMYNTVIGTNNKSLSSSVIIGTNNTDNASETILIGESNTSNQPRQIVLGRFNNPTTEGEINIGVLTKSEEDTYFAISSGHFKEIPDYNAFEIKQNDNIHIRLNGQDCVLQDKLNDIKETDLSDYYTKGEVYNKNEVNELIDEVNAGDVDLTNYYTKQEVDDKIPSLNGYATEQWVEDKKYLTEHQDLTDYAKKSDIPTIPTSNTAFTNDAGFITLNEVPPTDLSNYYTKEETYSKVEVDDLLENSGGGGTAGVEAINVGKDAQDWTQKTGVVSFYTDWYDGSYDVAIGGMSFFGVKPIDNSIILENAGGTVNGNTRCGIKINTDNFKTINGESIIGEGNITIEGGSGTINIVELTQAEYDALTEYDDNTFYVITDANKQYTTLEEVEQQGYLKAIPDTYVTDGELSTAISDKVSQNALNEAIEGVENKIPSLDGYATEQWVEDKKYLTEHQQLKTINGESIVGEGNITIEGGTTEETDPVFTEWKDKTIQVIIGSGATGSDNTQFDNISIGRGARGGTRTVAIGGYSYIDSKFSTSLGTNTKSSADATYSVIIGYSASGNSENSVAIGTKAKVESGVTNGCAIGANTESNATFNTNINNVLKGDTSNYAYILDADGNYVKIIDTYYTKTEIDNLIGGVSDKISDINSMI